MTCCNFNCRQGRDCPRRPQRSLSDLFIWIGGYLDVFSIWHDHKAAVRNASLSVTAARNKRAKETALRGHN